MLVFIKSETTHVEFDELDGFTFVNAIVKLVAEYGVT
jgi:hypothetical protein